MIGQPLTFKNFNGETVTETEYFHLSLAELQEMQVSVDGGLGNFLQHISNTNNHKELLHSFKKIILSAYGLRSPDGKHFRKKQEYIDDFLETGYYAKLMEMISMDAEFAGNFVNGLMPDQFGEMIAKMEAEEKAAATGHLPPPVGAQ